MYKYIGKPYTLNEFLHNSIYFERINSYLAHLRDFRINEFNEFNESAYCETDGNKELMFNEFLDLLSYVLLEPNDFEYVTDKLKNYSILFLEAHVLYGLILEILKDVQTINIPYFPNYSIFYIDKMESLIFEEKIKCELEFYKFYNISKEKNIHFLKSIFESSRNENIKLFNFFDVFLEHLRSSSFKSVQRFESSVDESFPNFSFEIKVLNSIESVKYSVSDKVLLFERLMQITNYEDISLRKKASILSVLMNESEETIRTYLRMLEKSDSESNNALNYSKEKVNLLFKAFKIR